MSQSNDEVENHATERYQKQKLFIDELSVEGSLDSYEKELKAFLSRYGYIIDIKILQNRALIRTTKTLRVCNI